MTLTSLVRRVRRRAMSSRTIRLMVSFARFHSGILLSVAFAFAVAGTIFVSKSTPLATTALAMLGLVNLLGVLHAIAFVPSGTRRISDYAAHLGLLAPQLIIFRSVVFLIACAAIAYAVLGQVSTCNASTVFDATSTVLKAAINALSLGLSDALEWFGPPCELTTFSRRLFRWAMQFHVQTSALLMVATLWTNKRPVVAEIRKLRTEDPSPQSLLWLPTALVVNSLIEALQHESDDVVRFRILTLLAESDAEEVARIFRSVARKYHLGVDVPSKEIDLCKTFGARTRDPQIRRLMRVEARRSPPRRNISA